MKCETLGVRGESADGWSGYLVYLEWIPISSRQSREAIEGGGENLAGCSKSLDFSPAQLWRTETRLIPSKVAGELSPNKGWLE